MFAAIVENCRFNFYKIHTENNNNINKNMHKQIHTSILYPITYEYMN